MNNNDRINLDLDVLRLVNDIKNGDGEAVFYFRKKGNKVFIAYNGDDVDFVNTFIGVIRKHKGFYDILSSAVALHEEDCICIIEE